MVGIFLSYNFLKFIEQHEEGLQILKQMKNFHNLSKENKLFIKNKIN